MTASLGIHRFSARDDKQRRLGIFYTPPWLARLLVDWALHFQPGTLLDPSFGGCAFLTAARDALQELGAADPYKLLFGFDVDRRANRFVAPLLQSGVPRKNIVFGDFLTDAAQSQFRPFSAVVGNPPWIRHHTMTDRAVERAQVLTRSVGASVPRTASAWAYFAILSAAYVAPRGRLALVLPGAALQSNYGASVIAFIERSFGSVRILHVRDRLFEDTEEESVILLAADRGGSCHARYQRISSIEQLNPALGTNEYGHQLGTARSYREALIPTDALAIWQEVISRSSLVELKSLVDIRIGVVTGANDFFLRSVDDPVLHLKGVKRIPIIAAKRWLSRPFFDAGQLNRLDRTALPTRLAIIGPSALKSARLRGEISDAERLGIADGHHCKKRDPWYRITDTVVPHLFLPYMSGGSPFAVINYTNATCTNSLHRLTLRRGSMRAGTSIVAASLSSLFRFESEMLGRYYGGGVLKLEPSEAGLLHVIEDGLSETFAAIFSRSTFDVKGARDFVDERVLRGRLRMSRAALRTLQRATQILANERTRKRSTPLT